MIAAGSFFCAAYERRDGSETHSELYSHGIRRLVARQAATLSCDDVVDTVRELTGASIGKRQVEELAIRAAQDVDASYDQRAAVRNPKDDLLIISTDGKGIAMRHEDLREGTRRAAERRTRKVETRLTPGERATVSAWRRSRRSTQSHHFH